MFMVDLYDFWPDLVDFIGEINFFEWDSLPAFEASIHSEEPILRQDKILAPLVPESLLLF
jgi:hypothetical protein